MNDINFTMYKLAGIIAEYDPFHNGHAWQLQQAKALGAQRVAVAMSCGLTQRGALPLLPESVRVQAALTCGADLVFALPAPYACSGAECFARAGVQLLAAAGCDALVFGAETPDAALLMEAARVLSGAEYRNALKARLAAEARSFAAARQAAVEAVCPGTGLAALLERMGLTRENLMNLELESNTTDDEGKSVTKKYKLKDFAKVEETKGVAAIARKNNTRMMQVKADTKEGYNTTKLSEQVQKLLDDYDMPQGYSAEIGGETENTRQMVEQMVKMLALGLLFIYLVMVAQFQSLKSPFIVMFTIPLAFTGGFLALLIAGINISVISLIGFVMLVGIIVNNGIVLVDCINQERLGGMERREAIIEAGVTRLRPILMTSLTTILGLTITALAKNAGTALMQPVALVCIGGLLYATLMTLFVVPCMYDIVSKKEPRRVDEKELELIDL